jgi:hypothetical protein
MKKNLPLVPFDKREIRKIQIATNKIAAQAINTPARAEINEFN